MQDAITLLRPDDFHVHLRDGNLLNAMVPFTARQFGRALVMPNLKPPITSASAALEYRQRILASAPVNVNFQPLMALYLTDHTSALDVEKVAASEHIYAFKYYPAGATTNSDSGVTDLSKIYPALEAMQRLGVILCIHGEVTAQNVDVFDREAYFVDGPLQHIVRDFPALKIVLEHITTTEAADFVASASRLIAATITPQHLLYNRTHIFTGGIRPHFYCLPILKRETHRQNLLKAASSGSPKFFLGTDSAPHSQTAKENCCGAAGCFTANAAIELYAEAFDEVGALDKLEGFASHFGADFYGIPRNTQQITLKREAWSSEADYALGNSGERIVPLSAHQPLKWRMV